MGITADYTGFFQTSYAVYLAAKEPESLLAITKWLYPAVAKHYGTTWKCVERNIRTVVNIAWKVNKELIMAMARHRLYEKPKTAHFLAIMVSHLLSSQREEKEN